MSKEKPLAKRVYEYITQNTLISVGDTVVVGVSGGADSVCLLSVLRELMPSLKIKLHVAHLNHLLRGEESDADAVYVSELARRWDLPVTVSRIDVKNYWKRHHVTLEEAARAVRYQFFADVACQIGANKIAVGHTADDQVETILMHIIRGSGMDGLRGMQLDAPLESNTDIELRLIRPLLTITREETEAHCWFSQLTVCEDLSNAMPHYLRNSIRHQLLPLLRSYNEDFNNSLLRTAHLVTEDLAFLEEQVSCLWDELVEMKGTALIVDTNKLRSLHPALQYRICREIFQRRGGSRKDIELRHIAGMVKALSLSPGKTLSLPHGLKLAIGYNQWFIGEDLETLCPFPPLRGEYTLSVPGTTIIPGWRIIVNQQTREATLRSGWEASFDYQATGNLLMVRGRRDGDILQPLGMPQNKKLQDFMVDAKIPRLWREHIPLVCTPQQIIWVAGWRIDDRVKVTPVTTEIISIKFTATG